MKPNARFSDGSDCRTAKGGEVEEAGQMNPFKGVADLCGLSEQTIRTAFSRKPITYQTACRIAKHMKIPVEYFRIKADQRGQNKKKKGGS